MNETEQLTVTPATYKFKLEADLTISLDGFFKTGAANRYWEKQVANGPWAPANGTAGQSSPDSIPPYNPVLKQRRSFGTADQVMFEVTLTNLGSLQVVGNQAEIILIFARERGTPRLTATPFFGAVAPSAPRCLLGAGQLLNGVPQGQNLVFSTLALPPNFPPRYGTPGAPAFEFSVVFKVALSDGTVREFSYDPEMIVDVEGAGLANALGA